MKKIFTICICVFMTTISVNAQSAESDVCIGVVCPEQTEALSTASITLLRSKIEQIASNNGVVSYSDGTFVMYPVLNILEERVVEGGMKNITSIKIEILLVVTQHSSGLRINATSTILSGNGYNRTEALIKALSTINIRDKAYASFLSESKNRIYSFYESHCGLLINKAKTLAAQQQYEAALSELACFPMSLPSYSKVLSVMTDIYKQYQTRICGQLIQKATGCIALKDYSGAVEYLAKIDHDSQCKSECISLLNQIRQQVDKEQAEAIDLQFRIFDNLAELEKQRISAIRDIAKAYYSTQPAIHYTQIVK